MIKLSNEKILKLVEMQKMSIQEILGKYNQGYVMEGCSKCGQQRDTGNLGHRTMGRTVVSGIRMLNPATCMTSVNQGETVTITVEQTNPGVSPYVYKIYVDGVLKHTSVPVTQTTYTLSYTVNEAGGVSPGVTHQYGSTVTDSCVDGAQTTILDVCPISVISIAPACPVPTARMIIAPLAVVTRYACVGGVCGVDPSGPYDTLEACQAVCAPVVVNLVANPGFETVDPAVSNKPQNWGTYRTGTLHVFTYPETGRPPSAKSVAIEYPTRETGKLAAWVQNVIVDPTKTYKLAGWVKTDNVIGKGARIQVDWKSSAWAYISTSYIMPLKTGTSDWTYYEGVVTPALTAYAGTIAPQLQDASGKVWFDDISLVKL